MLQPRNKAFQRLLDHRQMYNVYLQIKHGGFGLTPTELNRTTFMTDK